jgi:hypothetical protein
MRKCVAEKCGIVAIIIDFAFLNSTFAFSNAPECEGDLRKLVVPPLIDVVMTKSIVQTEIDSGNNGIYGVRLFVPADTPDNLNKEVSIGWVNLDINFMKAYDVTNDLHNKVELKINRHLYKQYVARCIPEAYREVTGTMSCNTLQSVAEKSEALIPGADSGRQVIGSGRLQFYFAPDKKCVFPEVFILPGEKVDAHSEYGDYTFVEYSNLKTGSNTSGWVKSNRLKPTGLGIAPRQ